MITIHHNFDPEQFEWLWAKYVNGGNVSQHCFPCLKGKQSKKFSKAYNPDMGNHPVIDMDETPDSDYDAVYFCGVSKFVPDPSIIATVATNRKVICNGKETYLTPLTTELRGKNGRMGKYWTFNGKTIDELYYETYFPNGKTFEEYQAEVEEKRKQQDDNI